MVHLFVACASVETYCCCMQEGHAEGEAQAEPIQAPEALLTPPSSPAREVNGATEGTGFACQPPAAQASLWHTASAVHVFLNTHACVAWLEHCLRSRAPLAEPGWCLASPSACVHRPDLA